MPLRMWTYDLAREQAPDIDHLRDLCRFSLSAGFDAIGLYLEHRFAYPSAPWAAGHGVIGPNEIALLIKEFPSLQIVPFVNLLGHCEGFLYTEDGKRFAEQQFKGLQACPCNEGFKKFASSLLDDIFRSFSSDLVHIGGDETKQLGLCPDCRGLSKTELFGHHFGPLAQHVLDSGRRPAMWGDMLLLHPEAQAFIPKETLIFDWQYEGGCRDTSQRLMASGFDVIGCPSIQTYNAAWMHVKQSEENVTKVSQDIEALGGSGVCVTTWECALFGAYDTLFPALRACRLIIDAPNSVDKSRFLSSYLHEFERYEDWANLMGVELPRIAKTFAHSGTRSSLKVRLLTQGNPFLAWFHHHEDLCGESGQEALALCERAMYFAPNEACKGVTVFVRSAIEFVRLCQQAEESYAKRMPAMAISALAPARQIFEELEKVAIRSNRRIGGSLADIERCKAMRRHIEVVIKRIHQYGDGSLGYLPSFEHLVHPNFMPHDQGAWWRINSWAQD